MSIGRVSHVTCETAIAAHAKGSQSLIRCDESLQELADKAPIIEAKGEIARLEREVQVGHDSKSGA